MAIELNGDTGITTPGLTNTGTETIVNLTTSGNTILGDASTDTLNVGNGGLVKDASGNVGINTLVPARKLDIAATAYSANQIGGLRLNNTSAVAENYFDVLLGIDSVGNPYGSVQTGNQANSYMTFFTGSGPTERMRITSAGNVGIGTASPTRLLDVSNTAGDASVAITSSTTGQSSVWFADTDTNIGGLYYEHTNNAMGFRTNDVERMRIDSSGNVGIGTSSPQSTLDLGSSTNGRSITWEGSAGGGGYGSIWTQYSAGGIWIGSGFKSSIASNTFISTISTASTYRSGISLDGAINNGIRFFTDAAATITKGSAYVPTERMRIDSSGNLGLGVTPSAWGSNFKAMQIGAGVGTTAIIGRTAQNNSQFGNNFYFDGTNYVYVGTGYSSRYSQVSGNHEWHIASSGTAGNAITFTEAMTLDSNGVKINASFGGSTFPFRVGYTTGGTYYPQMTMNDSGNLGLGVTPSAWSNVYKTIQLGGTSANYITSNSGVFGFTNNVYIDAVGAKYITTGTAASREYQLNGAFVWENASSGTAGAAVTLTTRMTLDASGGLILAGSTAQKATGTTWSNPSDIRLKDNVTDYSKGLAELMQVNVKEWLYNGKGGTTEGMKGLGVIADEIMTVLPDTVDTYQAKLNADDEDDTDIKKFDATEITWLMLNAIKEQQAMIDELKAKVAALEAA